MVAWAGLAIAGLSIFVMVIRPSDAEGEMGSGEQDRQRPTCNASPPAASDGAVEALRVELVAHS